MPGTLKRVPGTLSHIPATFGRYGSFTVYSAYGSRKNCPLLSAPNGSKWVSPIGWPIFFPFDQELRRSKQRLRIPIERFIIGSKQHLKIVRSSVENSGYIDLRALNAIKRNVLPANQKPERRLPPDLFREAHSMAL